MSFYKSSKYPKDFIDNFCINKSNNYICITLIGDSNKRNIRFAPENLGKAINFFHALMERHKVDVDIHYTLNICDKHGIYDPMYYIEFFWASYYDWYLDDKNNDLSNTLRIVHYDDVYTFDIWNDENIKTLITKLETLAQSENI